MSDPALEVAVRAARRAASVIVDAAHDLKRRPAHLNRQDLAAEAHGEAADAIVATLRAAFPEHAILGEESSHILGARAGGGYKWMIEPIDGIANFAHGYPGYGVSLALIHGIEITHAVVLDPGRDELFTAITGQGTHCNGVPIQISTCSSLEEALLGSVMPPRASTLLPSYLRLFAALAPRLGDVRRSGARMLDLAWVAAGRLDAVWSLGTAGWDMAAGLLLVDEAGGRVGDVAGQPQHLDSTDLIATTPVLFEPLREAITAARRPAIRD